MAIPQLDIYNMEVNHKNKCKFCKFAVIPRNFVALLGMSDIEALDFLTINWNTIDTQTSGEQIGRKQTDDLSCTNKNKMLKSQMQFNANTQNIPSDYTYPTVFDNNHIKTNYFLSGPCQEPNKKVSGKIT